MKQLTRDQWLAARANELQTTVPQLLEYLESRAFVIIPCDGSCDYDGCEGWIVRMDFAALMLTDRAVDTFLEQSGEPDPERTARIRALFEKLRPH